jgi:hypothetical protein
MKVYNINIGDIYYCPGHIDSETHEEVNFGYGLKVLEKADFGDYFYWCDFYRQNETLRHVLQPNLRMKNTVDYGVLTNVTYINTRRHVHNIKLAKDLLLDIK